MSINGVNNPLLNALGPLARTSEQVRNTTDRAHDAAAQRGVPQTATQNNATRAVSTLTQNNGAQSAVPAEAPPGTDPALWSVLTGEERAFFAKTAALGPLTYGRIKAATQAPPPAQRGVRLDVRA